MSVNDPITDIPCAYEPYYFKTGF